MNKLITSFLVLLLVVCLGSCTKEQEKILPSGNSVKIGFIGPMSGADKVLGKDTLQGIKTVLHMQPYLNNGDTIELLVEDDKNEPELTIKALEKLVETEKVAAVFIASSSASALAVNDLVDSYQTPVLVLLATHPDIGKDAGFVSQICFDNKFQGKVAALFVRDELLLERVAVFKNPYSPHSNTLSEEFIRKFRSIEGQISDVILVPSKTADYGEILSRLRDQDIQLLYMPMAVENVIEISKKLAEMDWAPLVMGRDALLTRALAEKKEEVHYLEDFFVTDLYSMTEKKTAYGKRAAEVYRSLFEHSRTSTFPALGVEGMAILMNAINRCQESSNRECINDNLHATVDFEGIMGRVSIGSDGKALRPLVVNRIKGDRMELVVKVY